MFDLVTIFLLVALAAYWFLVASKHPEGFPSGPRWSLPIIGNALDIGSNTMAGFENLRRKYGNVFGLFLGSDRTIVVSDFDLIQEVGSNPDFQNRQDFSAAAPEIRGGMVKTGNEECLPGLVFSTGPTWVEQRRYALHTLRNLGFGKNSMENMMNEEINEFCKHIEKRDGQPINIRYEFNIAVLNSLWAVVLNERLEYDDPKLQKLVLLMDKTFQEFANPLNLLLFMYRPMYKFAEMTRATATPETFKNLLDFVRDAITDHESTFQEDSPRDFTDYFLKEIRDKSRKSEPSSFKGEDGNVNLLGSLVDFFTAGSETTSTTLNWGVLYMLLNPDIQEKVQGELDQVTGRGRLPTMADRQDTPYTEAVIHEIQRCGNILPFSVTHAASKDTHLGGYFVPKGTNIFPNIGSVMKDPKNFPNPDKFDPSRYLTKDGKFEPHPMIIPFGVGKRRCLGETLAKMTLYLFFTGLLSTFNLRKEHENDYLSSEPNMGGTLSPQHYKVRFVPRK